MTTKTLEPLRRFRIIYNVTVIDDRQQEGQEYRGVLGTDDMGQAARLFLALVKTVGSELGVYHDHFRKLLHLPKQSRDAGSWHFASVGQIREVMVWHLLV